MYDYYLFQLLKDLKAIRCTYPSLNREPDYRPVSQLDQSETLGNLYLNNYTLNCKRHFCMLSFNPFIFINLNIITCKDSSVGKPSVPLKRGLHIIDLSLYQGNCSMGISLSPLVTVVKQNFMFILSPFRCIYDTYLFRYSYKSSL